LSEKTVYIYADESCLGNQFRDRARPGAAAGLIERFDERRGWYRRDYAIFEPDTTNNRMAIQSAIVGLESLKRPCDVVFTSDSQYLVKGMSEWVHGWARKGWKRKGGPIENLEAWRRLVRSARRHNVEWRWVRGHADHPKNEYANDLAVRTARARRSIEGLVPSGFAAWIEERQEEGKYLDFLDTPPDVSFRPGPPPPE
jgi:ribonuclease HI